MSGGLFALLDDVAAIAKVAAASLDDIAAQTAKAGAKAAGIVIDDAAVTPRYVIGFAANRELPIIGKIAIGSLRNKLLILTPAALALNAFTPWAITPLLMAGGAFLCFEGYEKLHSMLSPAPANSEVSAEQQLMDATTLEDSKVSGAIRTDMILSAEIMAITLAEVSKSTFWNQFFVLLAVGIAITVLVYGAVALIVKADDVGVRLVERGGPVATPVGKGLINAMPPLLSALGLVGMAAMLWVGGGIILHGLASYGLAGPEHMIEGIAKAIAGPLSGLGGTISGLIEWLGKATGAAIFGIALGFVIEKIMHMLPGRHGAAH
jgi:uncharacterized protein